MSGLRILCADDNVYVLRLFDQTFRAAGHRVRIATDGRAAIQLLAKDVEKFDVLITDTRMPQLDGFGLIAAARSIGFRGEIIVFAGEVREGEEQRYSELGVDTVITKPDADGRLRQRIARIAAQKRHRQQHTPPPSGFAVNHARAAIA
ncbi:MAG: response regulator [Chthoniobacterales bacterium]